MIVGATVMARLAATRDPKLRRGQVWCKTCGRMQAVDSFVCLRFGWPECHGETMTIDSPEERAEARP